MPQSEELHIHTMRMMLIDKESTISIFGAFLTAVFFTYVLYGNVPDRLLINWFSLITIIYILRWLSVRYFCRLNDNNSYRWEKIHIIGTLCAGLSWGIGGYFIVPENNALLQAVIILTVGGLVAAASATYSPSKYLAMSFGFPALLPLSLFFFEQSSNESLYMGMLILIFFTVTFASNRLMYEATNNSLLYGFKNESLVNELQNQIIKIEDMANEMSYQASHDMLTGLINRREFELRLQKAITEVKQNNKSHSLCYMDLDEFKVVNDTCGHIAGDELLKSLSDHLIKKIRGSDTIARLGGDEFGLLLPLCDIDKAYEIADNLREIIKNFHFSWENKVFDIGVSIGLVEINENSGSLTDILKAADSACYVAKELGRNRIHIYQENDLNLTQRLGHMHRAQMIQQALNEDQFVLYAQEIRANNDDKVKWHGEFLLRMFDADGNIVYPDNFIPAAERYHLMVDIDKWVINNAFRNIKSLENKFNSSVTCAINLSGQSICDKSFLEYVVNKFDEIQISPSSVCFEITETAAVANFFHAERLLEILKGMGCSFSLDDFGSGLSSFGYLKRLNVDYLKIDGSFVKNMMSDNKDYAIVKSISQIGKEMNMKTIAEFVENNDICNKLKELDIDYYQGYGISEPVPLSSIVS